MHASADKPIFRPPLQHGTTIGLLGGSFNPPHAGHIFISERLAIMLGLDSVWWLVAPQNPLKATRPPPSAERVAACQKLVGKRSIYVSDIEAQFGTTYTIDTIKQLKLYYPHARFIWLMGADSLCRLHCWKAWDALMREVAIAIYPRAGHMARAGLAPAAVRFTEYRYAPQEAKLLKFAKPPAWLLTDGHMNRLSSTLLRHQK